MRVDKPRFFAPAKPFFIGLVFGGVFVFLLLEGRAMAIWKAVSNPQAVNAVSYKTEIVVKK